MKQYYSVKQLLKKSNCKELGKKFGMTCRMEGLPNEISYHPESYRVFLSLRGTYRAAFLDSFKYWWEIMNQRLEG